MGLREQFLGKTVFLDTAPIIYHVEGKEPYAQELAILFAAIDAGEIKAQTSVLTLVEVLVLPLRMKEFELAKTYQELLSGSENLLLIPADAGIAVKAAELRALSGIKTPDALQLASAILAGADFFLTNDKQLQRVTEIEVKHLADSINTL